MIAQAETDHEGWEYALNFGTSYSGRRKNFDCVRRRLWVRSAKRFLTSQAEAAHEVQRAPPRA